MRIQMSERDKKILVFLIVGVVFFLLLWYGVRPIWDKNTALKQNIIDAQLLKQEKERKNLGLIGMRYMLEENQNMLEEYKKQFYPMMTSTEIDRRITGQILECGLFPQNMKIEVQEKGYTTLKSYNVMVYGQQEPDMDMALNEGPFYGLRTATVTLTVYGSYDDLWHFLNENINAKLMQRVCSYQFGENTMSQEKGEYCLDMVLELYMFDELEDTTGAGA